METQIETRCPYCGAKAVLHISAAFGSLLSCENYSRLTHPATVTQEFVATVKEEYQRRKQNG